MLNFRKTLLLFLCMSASFAVKAQDPGLDYFAKVPPRYKVPGLSPMQGFHISRMGMPVNKWVQHPAEIRFDMFRIKFSTRTSMIFSGGLIGGFYRQRKTLYSGNEQQATERINYTFTAPTASAGISYGFLFPYFISAKMGAYYGIEMAHYRANIPLQYSESDGVQTRDVYVLYNEKYKTGIQPYLSVELYRPLRAYFKDLRPMGVSLAATYFVKAADENPDKNPWALNFGIYWHPQFKR